MGIIEECIAEIVLEKTEHWAFQDITLSGKKIYVLSEIDGQKKIKDICGKLKIRLSEIKNIINELGAQNLIRVPENPEKSIPEAEEGEVRETIESRESVSGHLENLEHKDHGAPHKTFVYRGVSYEAS